MAPTRLRRAEQVEQNRELVLDAARRVFVRRGYAGASLEAIAEEAGFSKGVVYSQFGSKPDLFFALLERRIEERAAQNAAVADERSGLDGLLALMQVGKQNSGDEIGWPGLLVEFRSIAARDQELNARYAAVHAKTVDGIASVLARIYVGGGRRLPVPARTLAEFFLASTTGVALERAANPNALPDEDILEMTLRMLWPDDESLT